MRLTDQPITVVKSRCCRVGRAIETVIGKYAAKWGTGALLVSTTGQCPKGCVITKPNQKSRTKTGCSAAVVEVARSRLLGRFDLVRRPASQIAIYHYVQSLYVVFPIYSAGASCSLRIRRLSVCLSLISFCPRR